jgi:hypothetical protein
MSPTHVPGLSQSPCHRKPSLLPPSTPELEASWERLRGLKDVQTLLIALTRWFPREIVTQKTVGSVLKRLLAANLLPNVNLLPNLLYDQKQLKMHPNFVICLLRLRFRLPLVTGPLSFRRLRLHTLLVYTTLFRPGNG